MVLTLPRAVVPSCTRSQERARHATSPPALPLLPPPSLPDASTALLLYTKPVGSAAGSVMLKGGTVVGDAVERGAFSTKGGAGGGDECCCPARPEQHHDCAGSCHCKDEGRASSRPRGADAGYAAVGAGRRAAQHKVVVSVALSECRRTISAADMAPEGGVVGDDLVRLFYYHTACVFIADADAAVKTILLVLTSKSANDVVEAIHLLSTMIRFKVTAAVDSVIGAKGHFTVFPTRGLSYKCSPVEIGENKCRINFHFLPSPVTQ